MFPLFLCPFIKFFPSLPVPFFILSFSLYLFTPFCPFLFFAPLLFLPLCSSSIHLSSFPFPFIIILVSFALSHNYYSLLDFFHNFLHITFPFIFLFLWPFISPFHLFYCYILWITTFFVILFLYLPTPSFLSFYPIPPYPLLSYFLPLPLFITLQRLFLIHFPLYTLSTPSGIHLLLFLSSLPSSSLIIIFSPSLYPFFSCLSLDIPIFCFLFQIFFFSLFAFHNFLLSFHIFPNAFLFSFIFPFPFS